MDIRLGQLFYLIDTMGRKLKCLLGGVIISILSWPCLEEGFGQRYVIRSQLKLSSYGHRIRSKIFTPFKKGRISSIRLIKSKQKSPRKCNSHPKKHKILKFQYKMNNLESIVLLLFNVFLPQSANHLQKQTSSQKLQTQKKKNQTKNYL